MKVLMTLFPYGQRAKDKSLFPLEVIEEYIGSDRYKDFIVNKKLAFIGITHKDRKKDNKKLAIGKDDLILVNKNTIGYFTRLILPREPFEWEGITNIEHQNCLWAEGEIYDPADFEGDVKADIAYVRGLLKNGSRPPISGVLNAMWDNTEACRLINDIEGCDLTMSPSFTPAEIKYIKI